jgi:glycosyltransferase involved in cell wall biosynthesis
VLKVVHLISGLEAGGAERSLANLVAGLDRTRIRNVVISMTGRGFFGEIIERNGTPVHVLNMTRGVPSISALNRLRQLLRAERPDLLQTWLYHADVLGLIATVFEPRLPLVWNLRCSNMALESYRPLTRLVRRLLVAGSRMPAAVIANSRAGADFHQRLGYTPQRWAVIPNGFDPALWRPDADARHAVRAELGIPDDAPVLGLVARIDPAKDHACFLRAAQRVHAALPACRFVLAGGEVPSLAPAVAAVGLGAVTHLLGPQQDVPRLNAAFDVACLSSAFGEGFPNVLGEAMCCGIPCVTTDVGDAALVVGATGRVVPPADPQALAAAALDLLTMDPAARHALGAQARARIVDEYSLSATLSQYTALYENLLRVR